MSYSRAALMCLGGVLVACATLARGADVYRCGPPGALRYQSHPCDDGRLLQANDERNDDQRREASARARSQQDTAEALGRAHAQRQRSTRPSDATVIGQRATLSAPNERKPEHKPRITKSKHKEAKAAPANGSAASQGTTAFQAPKKVAQPSSR